ncbi:MAG: periplasmic heavy metal sensor [Flavitalea sp.]
MNSSLKSRRLIVIIIILLLTNIGILLFFLWPKFKGENPGPGKQGYGMTETLKREVGLDSNQVKELAHLREEHWKKMKPMFEDLQNTKNSFYALLKTPETPDSVILRAADAIAAKQKAIDMQVFTHFRTARTVCTPDQRPKYDSIIQVIIKRMSGPSRGNNRKDNNDRRDNDSHSNEKK